METPVCLLIFKRINTTEKIFEAIRQAKPSKLLVVADGPRADRPGEAEQCAATRAIIDRVDWDCEVLKNYSDVNLGCAIRPVTGITWAFEQVDRAIILEDDCLPDSSFFRFCEELLERYKDDERIMSISGENVQFGRSRTESSYYFSRYFRAWGWASWSRAWKHYDLHMKLWPQDKDMGILKDILIDSKSVKYWENIFQEHYDDHKTAWDYQWLFASWINSGLTIVPDINLVSNIGFGSEATHTTHAQSKYANRSVEVLSFPLKHPEIVVSNRVADDYIQNTAYQPTICTRIKDKIKRDLPHLSKFI